MPIISSAIRYDANAIRARFITTLIWEQEPLTEAMLAAVPPEEQRRILRERLFPLIQRLSSQQNMAVQITLVLLHNLDNSELLHMLEDGDLLMAKVEQAITFLQTKPADKPADTPQTSDLDEDDLEDDVDR